MSQNDRCVTLSYVRCSFLDRLLGELIINHHFCQSPIVNSMFSGNVNSLNFVGGNADDWFRMMNSMRGTQFYSCTGVLISLSWG